MSLKTVSQISLAIVSLVFIVQLVDMYSYLQSDSEWVTTWDKACSVIGALLWLPFMLFFWKIIKG
jgi:ABC-type Mn2+/Zn2+ transport system permease subunit